LGHLTAVFCLVVMLKMEMQISHGGTATNFILASSAVLLRMQVCKNY